MAPLIKQRHPFDIDAIVLLPDHLHYNPVSYQLIKAPQNWPYSNFHRDVERGYYPKDWGSGEEMAFEDKVVWE